jgi:tRNA-specific 2-thiouridylase
LKVGKAVRVVVAMSGGVDSSLAAALLKDQGYEVIGMMLRLWSEPGKEGSNRCCTPDALAMARRVAARLGIAFYAVDVQAVFRQTVVQNFIDGYTQGITPNPCLVCNRTIRFHFLLERALALGADYLATGHYARVGRDANGSFQLLRGADAHKDQSYVLHVLNQQQLSHALFPVGSLTKGEVRQLAHQFGLPVSDRPDSQDLCFLAGDDYRNFLQRHAPHSLSPGPILNPEGITLGEHRGLAYYTIGQRKGLGISSKKPLYVLSKEIKSNTLLVGEDRHLGKREMLVENNNWVSGTQPEGVFRAQVKIRYKSKEAWADVYPLAEDKTKVIFDAPQRDITPGQAAVYYAGELVLGGGIIALDKERPSK